jgi:Protein of unknown function (DUF3040)
MILSARERRILSEIERRLTNSDPRFVTAMSCEAAEETGWTRRGCTVVIALACPTALLCAALLLIGPALVAALLASATLYVRRHLPRATQRAHRPNR